MRSDVHSIVAEMYRDLRPRAPLPELSVEFFAYTGVNNTIRLRQGKLLVRLADVLEGAPEHVLRSIAHILLAKMYRKPVQRDHSMRYRRYVCSSHVRAKSQLLRQVRGRKQMEGTQGRIYDLVEIFQDLNSRFFFGLMGQPNLTWSRHPARNLLGHYDPAHNAIVVSRALDHPRVPRNAVEYIMYHEMLHLKHPVRLKGSRRCVHSAEFQAEEKLFPSLEEAKSFLRRL
jgi:hypothetical protein